MIRMISQENVDAGVAPASPASDMSASAAIQARGVTVSYGSKPVLRNVSFDIPEGRLAGIVGPNGAGKSTLLRAILGLVPVDAGSIRVHQQSALRSRRRIAYVPQTESVDWDFPVTVEDVVLMGRYARLGWLGRPDASDRAAATDALTRVGMLPLARRHIRQLSGGQQQRVFLARALAQQADVLLLDEPFAGVDAATERTVFQLMERLTRDGKTLVVVNHDLSVLDRFDMVMLLNQRIIAFGPTERVVTQENLRRTYGGRLTLLDRADSVLHGDRGHS